MRRKNIDNYNFWMICLELNWLQSELNVASFRICMDAAFFGVSRF